MDFQDMHLRDSTRLIMASNILAGMLTQSIRINHEDYSQFKLDQAAKERLASLAFELADYLIESFEERQS